MNGFILTLLSLFIDAPYLDISIDAEYFQQHTEIDNDSLNVVVDAEIYAYLEHEIGLDDIYTIFEEEKTISNSLSLQLEQNYVASDVASITSIITYNDIEYIQSYDNATISMTYSITSYAYNRETIVAYGSIENQSLTFFIEKSFTLPYRATFTPINKTLILTKDIRGYSSEEIYQEGYNDGYHDGEEEGYFNGYFQGYEEGEYNGSMTQPIFKLFNAVFRVIDNVLSVEILPGIKIWYILGVPFVFLIIQFFINLWR